MQSGRDLGGLWGVFCRYLSGESFEREGREVLVFVTRGAGVGASHGLTWGCVLGTFLGERLTGVWGQ